MAQQRQAILQEIKKVIVGQDKVIEELLIALLARGHCLLVGGAWVSENLTDQYSGKCPPLALQPHPVYARSHASDITGTDILEEDQETRHRHYRFLQGPIFRQYRAGRRNQSHATENAGGPAAGHARIPGDGGWAKLSPRPAFFVLATQNPIEQEGTIPSRKRSSTASCSISALITRVSTKRLRGGE